MSTKCVLRVRLFCLLSFFILFHFSSHLSSLISSVLSHLICHLSSHLSFLSFILVLSINQVLSTMIVVSQCRQKMITNACLIFFKKTRKTTTKSIDIKMNYVIVFVWVCNSMSTWSFFRVYWTVNGSIRRSLLAFWDNWVDYSKECSCFLSILRK